MNYEKEINRWNACHGIKDIDRQAKLVNEEVKEFQSDPTNKWELADWYVVACGLSQLYREQGESFPSSFMEAQVKVQELGAWAHLCATIQSNWTKYMSVKDYSLLDASLEAEKASVKYKGRYTGIKPVLSTCSLYYILLDSEDKVIKPSCFIAPEKFL